MKLLCDVYKSSRVAELYLYVERGRGLECLPEALAERFGPPVRVMPMVLQPTSRLVRADIAKVLEALQTRGFYLQMPVGGEDYMQLINRHNNKLSDR